MAKKNSNIEPKEGEVLDFLSTYKKSEKNLPKPQKPFSYILFKEPVRKALGFEGFPVSNCISISGYSDTGKTTLLLEGVIECQRTGILPIIVSTEGKFSFHHAKFMGMDCDYTEVVDEEIAFHACVIPAVTWKPLKLGVVYAICCFQSAYWKPVPIRPPVVVP